MKVQNNNCKLTQDNWAALQQVYESIYKDECSQEKREYWHYTSAKGILGIFKDYVDTSDDVLKKVDHCALLASNIRFMNDSKEYEEGVERYDKFRKKENKQGQNFPAFGTTSPINDNIYLISFCNNGDLLSQWKWYGKNSGIAIRFNVDDIVYRTYKYVNENGKPFELNLSDSHTKPLSVKYTLKEKQEYFNKLKQHKLISASRAFELLGLAFIPFCKHEGFAEEKESRLVFYIGDLIFSKSIKGKFEIVYNTFEEGRIKPALNVRMEHKYRETESDNIISDIIVGPGNNQELIFNFLIHLFDRKNYYYHKEKPQKNQKNFVTLNDHKVYLIKCADGKYREAYKCENGIVIMKSSIPFRG